MSFASHHPCLGMLFALKWGQKISRFTAQFTYGTNATL